MYFTSKVIYLWSDFLKLNLVLRMENDFSEQQTSFDSFIYEYNVIATIF